MKLQHPAAAAFDKLFVASDGMCRSDYLYSWWDIDDKTGELCADDRHTYQEALRQFFHQLDNKKSLAFAAWRVIKEHNFPHYMELCLRREEMPHGPQ